VSSSFFSLNCLSFNVRGLNYRWNEVLLLSNSFQFDIIILVETGVIDTTWLNKLFPNSSIYYQKGENSFGGVVVLVRKDLKSKRCECKTPNVCVVDIELEEKIRIVGIYAPDSKTWSWSDLTSIVTSKCVIAGDFNVDLDNDTKASDTLLEWADSCSLAPYLPDSFTSLRSNSSRTIDYAFSSGVPLTIQTYEGFTTSDHKPILSTLSCNRKESVTGKNVHWRVLSLFLSFVYSFWQSQWSTSNLDEVYNDYVSFLSLIISRCTVYFPLNKYRMALPRSIRSGLLCCRSIASRARRTGDFELRILAKELRNSVKKQIKHFVASQLRKSISLRYSSSHISLGFWSKTKRFFKPTSSTLSAFIHPNGDIVRDNVKMADMAADHYKQLYSAPNVFRPHPYVDAPPVAWDNEDEPIPPTTFEEVIKVVNSRDKKFSCDAHGLSSFLFKFLPPQYWFLFVQLFNMSFKLGFFPTLWKDVRIILLAKKDPICQVSNTRPISLLDVFLKIIERLFLIRFVDVLNRRGILPDTQSGFRSNFRLQTRVLLLIEQISSSMANGSPVATIFVDYKQAFDQLWLEGCVGKLGRLGIPRPFVNWIFAWLIKRRAFVEIHGVRSSWFPIERGCPQGSSLSPSIFITYHSDMDLFLQKCSSFYFADDLAASLSGHIGIKYTQQCLDLERRVKVFLDNLEYYSLLSLQPINYEKTEALWSARAWGIHEGPKFSLTCGNFPLKWCTLFKYLGYWFSPKLGWSLMINKTVLKIRQRIGMINSCRLFGTTSIELRRVLFSCYVLPYFTWLFAIFPLFTECQRGFLSHFYFTCLKRTLHCLHWDDSFFSFVFKELSLENRCTRYWVKYLKALSASIDGDLLVEQLVLNDHRKEWLTGMNRIFGIRRSSRFIDYESVLSKCLDWTEDNLQLNSIPQFPPDDIELFLSFPETF